MEGLQKRFICHITNLSAKAERNISLVMSESKTEVFVVENSLTEEMENR